MQVASQSVLVLVGIKQAGTESRRGSGDLPSQGELGAQFLANRGGDRLTEMVDAFAGRAFYHYAR